MREFSGPGRAAARLRPTPLQWQVTAVCAVSAELRVPWSESGIADLELKKRPTAPVDEGTAILAALNLPCWAVYLLRKLPIENWLVAMAIGAAGLLPTQVPPGQLPMATRGGPRVYLPI